MNMQGPLLTNAVTSLVQQEAPLAATGRWEAPQLAYFSLPLSIKEEVGELKMNVISKSFDNFLYS